MNRTIDEVLTDEAEQRGYERELRMPVTVDFAKLATTPRPRGPNLTLAFHRRARKLGLLREPEREIPPHIAVIIAIGVALIASVLTWSLGG